MVRRAVTGAHYGLRDWLAQRITAAVMGVFTLFLGCILLISPPRDGKFCLAISGCVLARSCFF